jgi:hypothetical protein
MMPASSQLALREEYASFFSRLIHLTSTPSSRHGRSRNNSSENTLLAHPMLFAESRAVPVTASPSGTVKTGSPTLAMEVNPGDLWV